MPDSLPAVKTALQAYASHDRAALERVIARDYRFTSPIDNALGRETYFATCWPNNAATISIELVHAVENGERVFVVYELQTKDKRFRNAELHIVRGGQIVSTEVYFGWNLPHPVPAGQHVNNDGTGHA